MHMRFLISTTGGIFLLIALSALMMGCPGGEKADESDTDLSTDLQATGDSEQESAEEALEQAVQDEAAAEWLKEIGLSREEVTEESLANITSFGVFMFPEAELVPGESFCQKHREGTEIYRLLFGIETSITPVLDWYRDNLESGVEESVFEFPDGSSRYGFFYQPEDRSWTKTITLSGLPAENRCQLIIELARIVSAEDESGESEEPEE